VSAVRISLSRIFTTYSSPAYDALVRGHISISFFARPSSARLALVDQGVDRVSTGAFASASIAARGAQLLPLARHLRLRLGPRA
jgi:hypothetical protein